MFIIGTALVRQIRAGLEGSDQGGKDSQEEGNVGNGRDPGVYISHKEICKTAPLPLHPRKTVMCQQA